jgi:hypothetical protein
MIYDFCQCFIFGSEIKNLIFFNEVDTVLHLKVDFCFGIYFVCITYR